MNEHHSVLVIHRGDRREVIGRAGHLDVLTAARFAEANGGRLIAMRHMRQPIAKQPAELVRIVPGEKPA